MDNLLISDSEVDYCVISSSKTTFSRSDKDATRLIKLNFDITVFVYWTVCPFCQANVGVVSGSGVRMTPGRLSSRLPRTEEVFLLLLGDQ